MTEPKHLKILALPRGGGFWPCQYFFVNLIFCTYRGLYVEWIFIQNVASRIYALLSSNPQFQDWGRGVPAILAIPGFSRTSLAKPFPTSDLRFGWSLAKSGDLSSAGLCYLFITIPGVFFLQEVIMLHIFKNCSSKVNSVLYVAYGVFTTTGMAIGFVVNPLLFQYPATILGTPSEKTGLSGGHPPPVWEHPCRKKFKVYFVALEAFLVFIKMLTFWVTN